MFVLDRDERRQEEIHSLEERLIDKVYFWKARELENYLLISLALLNALRSKQRDSATATSEFDTATKEQIEQIIDSTARSLYNIVLIKRIRTEIGGLREGLLPSEALSSLYSNAEQGNLGELILKEIKAQWEQHL